MLDSTCVIVCADTDAQMQRNAQFLQTYIKEQTGLSLAIAKAQSSKSKARSFSRSSGISAKSIRLAVSPQIQNAEAYRLTISPKRGITIEGGSPRGVFYGVQTLRKSLTPKKPSLPAAVITEQVQLQLVPRDGRTGVACGNEPLELERVEVCGEILEEIGFVRVVAVAEHDFPLEVMRVVPELGVDVGELRVELVLLRLLRRR